MTKALFIVLTVLISTSALAKPSQADLQFYRELTNKIRSEATFKIPMPDGRDVKEGSYVKVAEHISLTYVFANRQRGYPSYEHN